MSYEEQIMSKDKYPSIFSRQIEAIVFIIVFFATRRFENWGMSLGLIYDAGLRKLEIMCAI